MNPCAFCLHPDPRDLRRIHVITHAGADNVCGMCALQLLTSSHAQVTLMLEPIPVRA